MLAVILPFLCCVHPHSPHTHTERREQASPYYLQMGTVHDGMRRWWLTGCVLFVRGNSSLRLWACVGLLVHTLNQPHSHSHTHTHTHTFQVNVLPNISRRMCVKCQAHLISCHPQEALIWMLCHLWWSNILNNNSRGEGENGQKESKRKKNEWDDTKGEVRQHEKRREEPDKRKEIGKRDREKRKEKKTNRLGETNESRKCTTGEEKRKPATNKGKVETKRKKKKQRQ